MSPRIKATLRKTIYIVLFLIMMVSFVYLSEKYASNSERKIYKMNDYYENINNDRYQVVTSNELMPLLREGQNIIFIGSSPSAYSKKYIEELDSVFNDLKIDKVYYFDIDSDKYQRNANYYEILDLLKGYLITTDDSNDNLYAPSLYIIKDGQVMYYNIDTVATKNTQSVDDYWNVEQKVIFKGEITNALNKYYLNK